MEWLETVLLGIIAFILITKRWFRKLFFFCAGAASLFAMVASIMHSRMLEAIGFFILTGVCCSILGVMTSK